MSKPQLGYWDLRGLGTQLRIALEYMGVDYEEIIYKQGNDEVWKTAKPKLGMDASNLPYWIDDKIKLSESTAILKYITRTYKPTLVPTDPVKIGKGEMIEGILNDIRTSFYLTIYLGNDEAVKSMDAEIPPRLDILVKILGNNKFLLGNDLTYIDFAVVETLNAIQQFRPNFIQDRKTLRDYIAKYESVPAIAAYMNSPKFIKAPFSGRNAKNPI